MSEIEVVEESLSINGDGRRRSTSVRTGTSRNIGQSRDSFDSEKVPQTLVAEVQRFLRVADQISHESPRAAYLCRFYAFERAHMMDPRSQGRGVRQFKTSLLQRLEQVGIALARARSCMPWHGQGKTLAWASSKNGLKSTIRRGTSPRGGMGMKARETLEYALGKHAKASPNDHGIATPSRWDSDLTEPRLAPKGA
ncbi:hypothetical protein Syun_028101 [Stephania yunnanensis]|uniref:Vta1/callose synthase N-terminal domain-containing protein n=1 Tax=Stephania yunnanensis TaxID=152371 RepID=A0AAP0EGR3_9MAGN